VTAHTKLLFIGLDSADADLMLTWSAAGLLPTFRSLLEKGVWGRTRNPPGLYVGALWHSFATGFSPARHGRYWFRQIRSGTYQVERFETLDGGTEPFWNALSRAGRRVAAIDVPESSASENLNGIQLAEWGTHFFDPRGFRTWPPALAHTVTQRFGADPVGQCDRRIGGLKELRALRDDLLTRVDRKTELSRYFLEQGGWDLFLTVFGDAHCAGHQFWHLHDSADSRRDDELRVLGDPVKDVYVALDAAVGRLVGDAGPDTVVMLLCSHGMGPCHGGNFLLDSVLRRIENVPHAAQRPRMLDASLWAWRYTPKAVRQLLEPLRNRLVQRIDRTPTQVDSSRRYFQVPNNDGYGAIRINLVGREPHGRVMPGSDYDAVCESLRRELMALVNVDTGARAVRNVLRAADLYEGPRRDCLPDLLVEWNRDAPITKLSSPKIGQVEGTDPQHRTGDHRPDGLFLALGPSITPGHLEQPVSITDFAPTIATLLGVPLPVTDGQPIVAVTGLAAQVS
jgi:predicted AlkP superfamily phosphohydrolase/phosphomutase